MVNPNVIELRIEKKIEVSDLGNEDDTNLKVLQTNLVHNDHEAEAIVDANDFHQKEEHLEQDHHLHLEPINTRKIDIILTYLEDLNDGRIDLDNGTFPYP